MKFISLLAIWTPGEQKILDIMLFLN